MSNSCVCIHTDDKNYSIKPEMNFSELSTVNIGHHKTITNSDALNNKIWDSSETVYWQLDSEYKFATKEQQIDLIKLAFLETSLLTPLKIQQKRRQTGDAHIKINWLGEKDEKFFKQPTGILAFAYGPQVGIGGDITMNVDKLWLLRDTPLTVKEAFEKGYIEDYDREYPNNHIKFYDPVHTMKHEGGHAMGLRHLTDESLRGNAIMYPYYNGKRMWNKDDRNYLFSLYGKVSYWQRVIRLVQHKMGRF